MEATMWESKIWPLVFSAILPALLAAAVPGPFAGFGNTVDDAKKTDFFQFFHLEQTGESSAKDGKTIIFQPSGPKFHDLTHVYMAVNSKDLIIGAELDLSRSYVDSPRDGIYARDIAKSFLQAAVDARDRDRVDALIKEIDQLIGTDRPVIARSGTVQTPAGPPSDGYLVYLGKRDSFDLTLAHGQALRMENTPGNAPVLKISVH